MDIGAANGAMTLIAASQGSRVSSYEPDPKIFSDEPELALEFVDISDNQNIRLIASKTLTDSETFQLMRHGAGYIIANSSFSWWSAYLRYDRTVDVYLPNPWFKSQLIPNQMSPKEWRVVNSDFTD